MAFVSNPTTGKLCPSCGKGALVLLNRIVRDDKTVTIYWRCPSCSHVQVEDASSDRRKG